MGTHRGVVYTSQGGVATSQPLASSVGSAILRAGGSAVDAGIAVSAAISVLEPGASHLGGDLFLITHDAQTRTNLAFNGSGEAPEKAIPEEFQGGIPLRGFRSATVPGLVSGWFAAHERFGELSMADILAPAIELAENGFPANQGFIRRIANHLQENPTTELFESLGFPRDLAPGDVVRQPNLAKTLCAIAAGGRAAFYQGEIGRALIEGSGGWFTQADLDRHFTRVLDPITVDYRGYRVHGQPPPSQGVILMEELALANEFDFGHMAEEERIHIMVEAKKLAFEDRNRVLADPEFATVDIDFILNSNFISQRKSAIDPAKANNGKDVGVEGSDTTYFLVADKWGNAVSWIQSVFHGFGSSWAIPGTGVVLNNRLTGFSLDPTSSNYLTPGKRPAHTLNAWIVTNLDGSLKFVGGTPGANIQVQTNFQLISSLIDLKMGVQEVVEAPRWQHLRDGDSSAIDEAIEGTLYIESRFADSTIESLTSKGHQVQLLEPWGHGSAVQLLAVLENGTYAIGSDPRCEGQAIGI